MIARENLNQKFFHFSIDDSIDALLEASDAGTPLFENKYFSFLKKLHDIYNIDISLFLFYQKEVRGVKRNLTEVRDFSKELSDSGGWLRFGPHALDFETHPYSQDQENQIKTFNKIYEQIDRFAGSNLYAEQVRLHYYSESYELADYFSKRGVTALFSTDRPIGSYRMPKEIADDLIRFGTALYQGMRFIRTQFRIEFFVDENLSDEEIESNLEKAIRTYGSVVIYTHEYEMGREVICSMLERTCRIFSHICLSKKIL